MITESLISLVEIMSMLMPWCASVSNILAATPGCERMPMPTTESFAMPSVDVTSRAPISFTMGWSVFAALAASWDATVKLMSVKPFSLTFCTITSMLMLASAIVLKTLAAMPGLSGTPAMVTLAWFLSTATPRMTTSSILGVSSFTMVPGLWLKLLRTSNTTPNFLANSTERACMTFDPSAANSSISS